MSSALARRLEPVEVLWSPLPGMQTRFLARQEFEVLAGGAAGPGKTDCLINDLRFFHEPWCHRLFVRRTLPELRECIARSLKVVPLVFSGAKWNGSEKQWAFPSGARWTFSYCESMKDATRHQGAEYTELFIDELTQIHDESIYLFLRSRVRSAHAVGKRHLRVRATSNPGGPGHTWVKARFIDPCGRTGGSYCDKDGRWRAFVPGRLDENPYLDDAYRQNLRELPLVLQQQLLDGDWEAGLSSAFSELSDAHHLVEPFPVPRHWAQWGGHDWGYRHGTATVHLAEDEHGQQYVVDTTWVRLKQPDQIAENVWEKLDVPALRVVFAGADCWYDVKARGESGPTIADTYITAGIPVVPASISRRAGYNCVLDAVCFRERGPGKSDVTPRLRFMDTPGNRRLMHQLRSLIVDPDDPRDVYKVDCDLLTGQGGDDGYDALRYGLFTRHVQVTAPEGTIDSTFTPEVLRVEAERRRQSFLPATPTHHDRRHLEGAADLGIL